MPIIQDPRMNPRQEASLGIAYIEESFELDGVAILTGHYFYKKLPRGNNNSFNIRFLPQGFPIEVIGTIRPNANDWRDVDLEYYNQMFPNLQYDPNVVLRVQAAEGYSGTNTQDLDSRLPMVAYTNRNNFNEERGLNRFERGDDYDYDRPNDRLRRTS